MTEDIATGADIAWTDDLSEEEIFRRFRASGRKYFLRNGAADLRVSPVTSLQQWSDSHHAIRHELEPAQQVQISYYELDEPFSYTTTPIFLTEIPDATIVAGWDFVIAPTGEVLRDSGYRDIKHGSWFAPHFFNERLMKAVHIYDGEVSYVDETVLFLSASEQYQFGHWMTACLPRLRGWRKIGDGEKVRIAVPHTLPQHHRDQLPLFGVNPEDILECAFRRTYKFKKLLVASQFDEYLPNPGNLDFLYQALGPKPAALPREARRVYLQRQSKTRGRAILNHADVVAVLSEFQFETMRRPQVTIAEQNRILNNADIVVTVFGTDMLALFQLPRGADLIILCPDYMADLDVQSGSLSIATYCELLGIRMSRLLCRSAATGNPKTQYFENLSVDTTALRVVLEEIIELRRTEASPPSLKD